MEKEEKENNEKNNSIITKEVYDNKINEIKNNLKILLNNLSNYKKISPTLPDNLEKFIENFNKKIEEENILIERYKDEKVLSMKYNLNLNKFEELILLNETMQESIKKEFKLYEILLTQNTIFKINHPIQNFIQRNPEIIKDSNIFNKLKDRVNIGKIYDNLENEEIKEYMNNNIEFKSIYLDGKNQNKQIKDMIIKNLKTVKNLYINNLEENDFHNIFLTGNSGNTFEKMRLNNCKINEMRLSLMFQNIYHLYCTKIQISPNAFDKFHKIRILSLDNCNLIDYTFSILIKAITPIKETLIKLSLIHNKLTIFSLNGQFSNLEEIDLSYNKISRFDIKIITKLPQIKIVDLTCNNYAYLSSEWNNFKKFFSKGKLCLFFENMFVMRKDFKEVYFKYFNENLQLLNFPLKKLNFECFFDENNFNLLKEINFSKFEYSLNSINLNCCDLTDDKIFDLLENNLCLFNLKELFLATNKITNKFFGDFIKKKLYNLFPNLKIIDLTSNIIQFNEVKELQDLKNFLLETLSLKFLNLKYSSIENLMSDYLKKEIKYFYDSKKSKKEKLTLKEIESEMKTLIELLKENSNIKINMRNILKKEYTSKIKKHFNWIYYNFSFEEK